MTQAAGWQQIVAELSKLDDQKAALYKRWTALRAACAHPRLPVRALGEEHRDTCPDCGHVSYAYWM